ncbi:MAG TPA: GEVED domain-containing protein, partial [Chitinophagaceae bacterium]|nr:GEVED domain-containing protein [Chitinophagaceae bacterium]
MKTTFRFGRFPGLPVRTIVFLLVAGFGPFQLWSQTWTPVTLTAPHNNKGVMMLLSDGTVLCKTNSGGGDGRGNIYDKLTPNASGSYTSGTWSSIAPMANTRLYYSSQILKDGRMYVCGGEYGTGGSSGEVYNPTTNTWTNTPNPGGFVSDANSEILEDGRVLQNIVGGGSVSNKIYNPATNTFVSGPTAVGGANESAWLKLPDNTILYVTIGATTAQRYNPVTNTWIADANCPVALYDSYGYEMGGAFMLPDGRGFFIGATGHTAYYTPSGTTANGTWTAGPDIPGPRGVPDGPACMMRDGKILLVASPLPTAADHFPTPTTFWIFDYLTNTYTNITAPDGAASWNIPTYVCNMLQLPNGQVLFARFDNSQYYVFTPAGGALASGVPTISSISLIASNTYRITGTRFNGISQGANYGDDWQMSTNYPVIRLQNGSNVYYCRSYNWNSTGVRRGSLPDTAFFVTPGGLPAATYSLYVTANGIPSAPSTLVPNLVASVNINITSGTNPSCDGLPITFLATPNNGGASPTYQWKLNGNSILGATNSSYTTSTLIQGDVITCVMTASIVVTGSPATSNAFTMTINDNNAVISASATPNLMCKGEISSLSASAAYCIPSYGIGSGSGDYIGRVTLSGTALNNISGASSSPYYTLYPQSGSTTGSVTAGSTYTLTLSPGTFGSSNRLAAWIDYNQDKSFSGNEKLGEIVINASYPTTGTIVFTIPATAKNGTVRLRVREVYAVVNIEPCKPYTYGETEDYALTLSGGGAVVPIVYDWSTGSSGSLVTTVPAYSQTYTVTVTDVNGCPTHTSVPVVVNAPNATATATPQTICSGATASLSAAKVTAYCTPTYTYGTGSNDYISLVSISGTTLNSSTGASGSPYYTLYPASGSTTATLSAGSTYTLVLSPGTYPFNNGMAAFIDWDHDYIFNNGAEKIGETGYVNASPATASIVFTVPGWVKSGTTRLRVREAFATTTLDACTDYYYGETEDYVLTISGGVSEIPYVYAWTGGTTPTTGTPVSASPTNTTQYVVTATDQYGCSATASTAVIVAVPPVITMNPPSSSGICNGGSTTLSITEVTPTYCTPAYNSGTIDGDYIGSVSIAGTTLNNVTVGAVSPFYTLFPAFGSATATLTAGTTYTLSLSPGTYGSGNNMAAWLDYDQNGSFYDATEKLGELLNVGSFPGYGEIVFTIPSFVQNGTIRLRVREAWNTFGINACSTYNYGETEDYTLTITGGTAANNFTWSPATVPSSGASVVATPTYSQTYTVTASNAT